MQYLISISNLEVRIRSILVPYQNSTLLQSLRSARDYHCRNNPGQLLKLVHKRNK